MNKYIYLFSIIVLINFTACGQSNPKQSSTTKNNKMNTTHLTNETIKQAFEAWQNGDKNLFLSFFTNDAKLFDDGNPRDFKKFVSEACGHEKFTNIDKVENNGLDITGDFHTESWGDFKTYFKFQFIDNGKINSLEIGQVK